MTFPTAGSNEDVREAATRAQIDGPRLEGDRLLAGARALMSKNPARQGRRRAEAAARKALACYASALNWAEDTPVFDDTHSRLEEAGLWTRRTFGCQLSVQGVTYTQKCPVALAHKRFGLSIGGVGRRTCSLCGDDLSECDHMRDVAYSVPGGLSELGWCRVCECNWLQSSSGHPLSGIGNRGASADRAGRGQLRQKAGESRRATDLPAD